MGTKPNKRELLQQAGTLNTRPERVRDALFRDSEFFDPCDLLQVRYEMVRLALRKPLAEAAGRFGFSVPTCVRLKRMFREGGLQALRPARRGPRGPHKITAEVLAFVAQYRSQHGPVGCRRLVPLIERRFGVRVHARSLDKALLRGKKRTARAAEGRVRR